MPTQHSWRHWLRRRFAPLATATVLWPCSAVAASFAERLHAVGDAVDVHLAAQPNTPAAPLEWRKLLWLGLAGDKVPDALVVLRSRRDECAVAATSAQPCRALILASQPNGGYKVVTEFVLRVFPVAFLRSPSGIRELFYSRDTKVTPTYGKYRFDGEVFSRADGDFVTADIVNLPLLVADDRNMPLWSDQAYAARQFPNEGSWMAPFRLHFDASTVSDTRTGGYNVASSWYPKDFEQQALQLTEALMQDAQDLARALPWPHSLELRLWSCVDWMVERRFWEVEDRRLGRPGACVEPGAFVRLRGIAAGGEAQLDTLRLLLLQQVGLAYIFRVAPLSSVERQRLRQPDNAQQASFIGAVAGLAIGNARRLITLERSGQAVDALLRLSDLWFSDVERGLLRFVTPTPELRSFVDGLGVHALAVQCLRKLAGQPPHRQLGKVSCDAAQLETTRRLVQQLQGDLRS